MFNSKVILKGKIKDKGSYSLNLKKNYIKRDVVSINNGSIIITSNYKIFNEFSLKIAIFHYEFLSKSIIKRDFFMNSGKEVVFDEIIKINKENKKFVDVYKKLNLKFIEDNALSRSL